MRLCSAAVLVVGLVSAVHPECTDFSVSQCTGDENAVYLQINTSRDKCQQYCAVEEECQFYRYSEKPVQGVNCLLYQEPFKTFISHCNQRAGPREPSQNCLVPTEDTCDVVNSGRCIYYGTTLETFSVSLEDCIALCGINPGCKLWTHEKESQHCELLDSTEASCNEIFGPRSLTPTECGEEVQTTTTESNQPTPPNPIPCPADSPLTFFPDEDACGSYWECYKGVITHMSCTNCFLFDAENSWCSPPEFVNCGARPTDPDCQVTTAPGPCPYPNGYFRDPDSCDRYFVCKAGLPVSEICPTKEDENGLTQQLLYNYDVIQCDWSYRVDCEDRPICDSNYEHCQCQGATPVDPDHVCPAHGVEIISDPFNCSRYYVCEEGVVIETIMCDEGQYYDEKTLECSSSPSVCNKRPICSGVQGVADCHCYVP